MVDILQNKEGSPQANSASLFWSSIVLVTIPGKREFKNKWNYYCSDKFTMQGGRRGIRKNNSVYVEGLVKFLQTEGIIEGFNVAINDVLNKNDIQGLLP